MATKGEQSARRRVFGAKVTEARLARSMSQAALAAAVTAHLRGAEEVRQSAVSFWESGRSAPTPGKVQAIEAVLGFGPGELGAVLWPRQAAAVSDDDLVALEGALEDLVRQVAQLAETVGRVSRAVRQAGLLEPGDPEGRREGGRPPSRGR